MYASGQIPLRWIAFASLIALAGCALIAGVKDGDPAPPDGGPATGAAGTGTAAVGSNTGGAGVATSSAGAGATTSTSVTSGSGGSSAYRDAVLADNPSAYWRLDETTGPIAKDSGPNGYDCTYMGNVVFGVPGALAGDAAARLDGLTAFVDCGNRFGFVGTAPFSVEFWIRPLAITADWKGIVTKEVDVPARDGWLTFLQDDPKIGFGIERWTNGASSQAEVGPTPLNQYAYAVGTFNGGALSFYINGSLAIAGQSSNALVDQAASLVIGARYSGTGHFVSGDIDEVAIYDHALTATAIAAHYAAAH